MTVCNADHPIVVYDDRTSCPACGWRDRAHDATHDLALAEMKLAEAVDELAALKAERAGAT